MVEQQQFEKPTKLDRLDLEVGRPWKIVRPGQDIYHMEGEHVNNQCCYEFCAIRKRLWKDFNTPPELEKFPIKWYYVTSSAEDREVRMLALEELAHQTVVGVSLQGQVLN